MTSPIYSLVHPDLIQPYAVVPKPFLKATVKPIYEYSQIDWEFHESEIISGIDIEHITTLIDSFNNPHDIIAIIPTYIGDSWIINYADKLNHNIKQIPRDRIRKELIFVRDNIMPIIKTEYLVMKRFKGKYNGRFSLVNLTHQILETRFRKIKYILDNSMF